MGAQQDAERVEPDDLAAWTAWLAAHHDESTGIWLVTAKKSSGRRPFTYEEGVIEALRYGWVDSKVHSLDEERTMTWYCPRKPDSIWARPNKERIARLEAEGRLEPAGRAAVAVAKANGSWTILDPVEDLVVPDDLAEALVAAGARTSWEELTPSVRKGALAHLVLAKRPETRARRLADIVAKTARGERPV